MDALTYTHESFFNFLKLDLFDSIFLSFKEDGIRNLRLEITNRCLSLKFRFRLILLFKACDSEFSSSEKLPVLYPQPELPLVHGI